MSATWTTPKTDWSGAITNGEYVGDRFNYDDFNRIKNNLEYLREYSLNLHDEYEINDVGDDKTVSDFFYADEINALEENLEIIAETCLSIDYGDAPTYEPNGYTMDYVELNRLESAILDLYENLYNEYYGRRHLEFNFE